MHPAVLGFWLAQPDPSRAAWSEQRAAVLATAAQGEQWGTITSEPGSGGDILSTKAQALPADGSDGDLPGSAYRISGDKHFGSGSGVTSFMVTTAMPDGEEAPAVFILDVRDRPWDGSTGLRLTAEWDGAGMAATQSHAMRLDGCPAIRFAWDGPLAEIALAAAPLISCLFTAVILGVLDEAIRTARLQLEPKADSRQPYEQVEWTRAELDHWLAVQAYEGALRAVESGDHPRAVHATLRAKGGRRRAGRSVPQSPRTRRRRRNVLTQVALRLMVRGRSCPRLPTTALGARIRQAVPHLLRVSGPHVSSRRALRCGDRRWPAPILSFGSEAP